MHIRRTGALLALLLGVWALPSDSRAQTNPPAPSYGASGQLQLLKSNVTHPIDAFADADGKRSAPPLQQADLTFPINVLEVAATLYRIKVKDREVWVDPSDFQTRRSTAVGVTCLSSAAKVTGGTERGANESCPTAGPKPK